MRVLIADDLIAFRKSLTAHLVGLGYHDVTAADDGDTAWQALGDAEEEGKPYELIICDWHMPRLDGLELLRRVRHDARFRAIPFLILSGDADMAGVRAAIELGVDDYLVKPINGDTLHRKLLQAIERRAKMTRASGAPVHEPTPTNQTQPTGAPAE